jgi:hypothetical protein
MKISFSRELLPVLFAEGWVDVLVVRWERAYANKTHMRIATGTNAILATSTQSH